MTRRFSGAAVEQIERGGLTFEMARRPVKRLNMRVTPDGRIGVSVPLRAPRGVVLAFLDAHIGWAAAALERAARTAVQSRCLPGRLADGQTLWIAGQAVRLVLQLAPEQAPCILRPQEAFDGYGTAALPPVLYLSGPDETHCRRYIKQHLRGHLSLRLPGLFAPLIRQTGLEPAEIRIRDMRTRWGSCNTRECRIWMSLNLAGYPDDLVSYVALHELVHLAEPSHNQRFKALMTRYMPDWRQRKQALRFPEGPEAGR